MSGSAWRFWKWWRYKLISNRQRHSDKLPRLLSSSCVFTFRISFYLDTMFVTPSQFIQSPFIQGVREGQDYCCIWSWDGDHFLSLKVPLWAKIQTNWGGDKQKDIFNWRSRKIDYGRRLSKYFPTGTDARGGHQIGNRHELQSRCSSE